MTGKPMTSRRSFLKSGAIVAAPIAAVAAPALAMAADDGTRSRLARLEDERAIADLHASLMRRINRSGIQGAGDLFASGQAPELGQGLSALVPDHGAETAAPEFSADGQRATARYACHAHHEVEIAGNSTLEQMARLQGQVSARHSEERVLVADYARQADGWVVERLRFA